MFGAQRFVTDEVEYSIQRQYLENFFLMKSQLTKFQGEN